MTYGLKRSLLYTIPKILETQAIPKILETQAIPKILERSQFLKF